MAVNDLTLNKVPTSATDNNVDVVMFTKSLFERVKEVTDPSGLATAVWYKYITGDESIDLWVVVRIALDGPKAKNRKKRVTLRLLTSTLIEDADAINQPGEDIECGLFWVLPVNGKVSASQIRNLTSAVYGLTFVSVTSGAPSLEFASAVAYGITKLPLA